MTIARALAAGLLIGATLASSAFAAEEKACLQSNRIWGWKAVNDRTLIITDRNYKRFTVHMTSGCVHLDQYAGASIAVRTHLSLGCVGQGDFVSFVAPGLGRLSCAVTDVTDAPADAGK